ncbi:MAG TPA: SDR family NAD(P)-dependent oxidoreductase [Balneolaceae bacterium]|nr:SDR family NAD(P)-dependent oxidoreductase [Balneolaceae bacterium]
MKLEGKTALVTGASRGIGRAVAEGFAAEGARVFLTGHTDKDALNTAIEAMRNNGGRAEGGLYDVGNSGRISAMADHVQKAFGTADILVNNAGIIQPSPFLELSEQQWDRTIKTHLYGTFYCTQTIVNRFMKSQKSGKVINVTAPTAIRGGSDVVDYASAKGGITAFTKNVAKELKPMNIQVNAVLPVASSRMTDSLAAYYNDKYGRQMADRLSNLAEPSSVVPAFIFLAGDESDYITGQILGADDGRTA